MDLHYSQDLLSRALPIKAIVFDVDGVLTDGGIIYAHDAGAEAKTEARELKKFNVKDGFSIVQLRKMGYLVGMITGRDSAVVRYRAQELKLDFHYHGAGRKSAYYEQIKQDYGLRDEQIAYVGDDVPDLGVLNKCGLAVCPSDARPYIKQYVHMVSAAKGGEGVLREIADLVLFSQGRLQELLDAYLFE